MTAGAAFSTRRKTWFAMASPFFVLIVVAITLWTFRSADRALAWVEHSEGVLEAVREVEVEVVTAESAARASVITGSASADTAFEEASVRALTAVEALVERTRDNVAQSAQVAHVQQLTNERVVFLREGIGISRTNPDLLKARSPIGLERSRALREEIRRIADHERTLMAKRRAEHNKLIEASRTVLLIGVLMALSLAVVANLSVRRDVADGERNLRIITGQAEQLAVVAEQLHENEQRLAARLEREQDLTDGLARLNREGAKTILELARSNQDLDQFAYVASHDLRAPLRAIASLAAWIEEDVAEHASEDTKENFALLQGRIHRMEGLIDGILTYSRVGRGNLEASDVDTRALVEELGATAMARRDGVEVELTGEFPTLRTERVPLEQVFGNLISNALKYAPGKKIQVVADGGIRPARFSVVDDGPGIDPRFHERIFGFFQTLAPRDKVESTGIGLAVVKKQVEARGGEITVISEVGKGACFTFTWPETPAQTPDEGA